MSGIFVIRPVEANLTHNTDLLTKMSPYISIIVGNQRVDGQICTKAGKHPVWSDAITIPALGQHQVQLEVMDKDKITKDDHVGGCIIDLNEVQASGKVSRWYPLTYKTKAAGEILLEIAHQSTGVYSGVGAGANIHNHFYQGHQQFATQAGSIQQSHQHVATGNTGAHVWTEQRQVVEPHTFMKEVEVTETRSTMKNIEVMEPHKVLKDVQYTQAVPVKKQIEVMEPQVVVKEVEVIEPRLVTKTIQVVENVPVMRQVEVIEMRSSTQQVQTMEPQTFTKQVEVTEYVPVTKQVEVSQPVTFKKNVEFVESVITTQTITKEMQQPVIINQEITTTVGPASVVGVSQEMYVQFGQLSITDRQALATHKRWVGHEHLFHGLSDEERYYEQHRLSRLNEQDWTREQQRLAGYNAEQRLAEQRKLYGLYTTSHSHGHHHHHSGTTGTTSTSHVGNVGAGHSSHYNPSPNF